MNDGVSDEGYAPDAAWIGGRHEQGHYGADRQKLRDPPKDALDDQQRETAPQRPRGEGDKFPRRGSKEASDHLDRGTRSPRSSRARGQARAALRLKCRSAAAIQGRD